MSKQTVKRMVPTGGYTVLYKLHGKDAQFITLDRSRAEEYAKEHKGTWHRCYIELEFEVDVPEING
jgi:hypothetical protein